MTAGLLSSFGVSPVPEAAVSSPAQLSEQVCEKRSPIDGSLIGVVTKASLAEATATVSAVASSFAALRSLPMPQRGQIVREIGEAMRARKTDLAALVSLEAGKIKSEALGEIQEIVDVCEYATGLSRTIGGRTLAS